MTPAVEVDASEAVRHFSQIVDRSSNMRPLFDRVADDFHDTQRAVFESDGASQGTRWAPLKPEYLRWRERSGRGTQLLRFTNPAGGLMFRSLTQKGGPQQVRQVRPDELRVGTRVGIAAAHQQGRGPLPARPLVNITSATEQRWRDLLMSHLFEVG